MRAMHRDTDPFSADDTDPLSEHHMKVMQGATMYKMLKQYGMTMSPRVQAIVLRHHGYTPEEAQRDPSFPRTATGHVSSKELVHWLGYGSNNG